MVPLAVEYRVEQAVTPGAVGEHVISQPAFIGESRLADDRDRGVVLGAYRGGYTVQLEFAEPESYECLYGVRRVASPPLIRADGVADLASLNAFERDAAKSDQRAIEIDAEVEFSPRCLLCAGQDSG